MKIPIDKDKYSESSKRSIGHEYLEEFYKDIEYSCYKCSAKSVFSAEEQQKAFEIRKEYMWCRRTLCNKCWTEMRALKKRLTYLESHYCSNKKACLNDRRFLRNWLKLLKEFLLYSKKGNTSRIEFIEKHLNKKKA